MGIRPIPPEYNGQVLWRWVITRLTNLRPVIFLVAFGLAFVLSLAPAPSNADIVCVMPGPLRVREVRGAVVSVAEEGQDSATGQPVPGAVVQLFKKAPAGEPRDPTVESRTDAEGRFHFEGIPPGDYRIQAGAEGQREATRHLRVRRFVLRPRAELEIVIFPPQIEDCGGSVKLRRKSRRGKARLSSASSGNPKDSFHPQAPGARWEASRSEVEHLSATLG